MSEGLAAALVLAQSEMPKVEKRGRNPHFKNEYATLDDLLDAVRPVLNRHGLAVIQFPTHLADGAPALTTTLLHGGSGEQITSTMPLVLAKNDMQGVGAAITYARRYMLASALGIAEGTDDDGTEPSARLAHGNDGRVEDAASRPETAAPLPQGEPFPPPAADAAPTNNLISDKQRGFLFGEFNKHGFPEQVLRDVVHQVCGDEVLDENGRVSTKLIRKPKFQQVLDEVAGLSEIPF